MSSSALDSRGPGTETNNGKHGFLNSAWAENWVPSKPILFSWVENFIAIGQKDTSNWVASETAWKYERGKIKGEWEKLLSE